MATDKKALGGRGTDLFAGIPVNDFKSSLEWYQQLFGAPPSFFPNDREAVWEIAQNRWVYIIVQPDRAGGSVQTIMLDDLEAQIEQIAERGIRFSKEETPAENVRKVMYYDPDGNELGLGRAPSE
ncbi:VOC family protein [Novosphingobium sp. EMRT-2]|uniref:VOC family protein n=1 Tax=Novosphingobium sp. EMRT-2 TaxID=2571749 RepID=UPI0010BDD606|nr:VOC family protein [Novosphingobium sp. EMRT-2]QCI96239.1 VOC family protein [Novosphingobium sp. EMRT-2]